MGSLACFADTGSAPFWRVFFNLTNMQWFTGGALSLYALVPDASKESISEKLTMILAGLTGPFSVLIAPVLVLQLVILRDFRDRISIYLIVIGSAIVQLLFIAANSERINGGTIDTDPNHWIQAVLSFLNFGAQPGVVRLFAIAFWMLVAFAAGMTAADEDEAENRSIHLNLFFLVVATVIYFAAGIFACKEGPQILSPIGSGARYFYLPYAILLFSVFLLARDRWVLCALLAVCIFVLVYSSHVPFSRNNLQFRSYVDLAEAKPGVLIPLHPQWGAYPGWFLRFPPFFSTGALTSEMQRISIPDAINFVNISKSGDTSEHQFVAINSDPQMTFKLDKACKGRTLAVEAELTRPIGSWVQVFWSNDGAFSEEKSIRRYYPQGNVVAEFAFP